MPHIFVFAVAVAGGRESGRGRSDPGPMVYSLAFGCRTFIHSCITVELISLGVHSLLIGKTIQNSHHTKSTKIKLKLKFTSGFS